MQGRHFAFLVVVSAVVGVVVGAMDPTPEWHHLGMGAAILFFGLLLVMFPMTFREKMRYPLEPRVDAAEADDVVPPALKEELEASRQALVDLGFEELGGAVLHDLPGGMSHFTHVLAHRYEPVLAMASATYPEDSKAGLLPRFVAVQISSEFADGTEAATHNAPLPLPFPPPSWLHVLTAPSADVPQLLQLHKRMLIHKAQSKPAPRDRPVTEIFREGLIDEFVAWEKDSYLWADDSAGCYRLTWKGTWVAISRQLWPMSWLLRFQANRRSRALLAESRLAT